MHPRPCFGGFWASAVRCLCVFAHPRGHPRASAGGAWCEKAVPFPFVLPATLATEATLRIPRQNIAFEKRVISPLCTWLCLDGTCQTNFLRVVSLYIPFLSPCQCFTVSVSNRQATTVVAFCYHQCGPPSFYDRKGCLDSGTCVISCLVPPLRVNLPPFKVKPTAPKSQ